MTTTVAQTELKPIEVRTLIVGFILVGLTVAVTTVSSAISGVLSGMIVFMAVGNPLFSFPWSGCV